MHAKDRVLAATLGGLFISLIVIGLIAGPGMAAPDAAPTPVANLVSSDSATNVSFLPVTNVIADANSNSIQVPAYEWVDVQYILVQGTTNTATITTQYSNDNSNWANGLAITTSAVVSGTDITRVPVFGRYMRFAIDVGNTNSLSVTILGLAK